MAEPIINVPVETLTAEEKHLYANPHLAKFRLFSDGEFYPVAVMFDAFGQTVTNPLHAFSCVAFNGKWVMMQCHPGDVEPIREGRPWI
jgi:hypothetical protein